MAHTQRIPTVAILVSEESTASVVYGMYDFFRSAGRDWGTVVDGKPGPECMAPKLVARSGAAFEVTNGVRITPHASIRERTPYDVVCVPELAVSPEQSIKGQYPDEVAWLREQHAAGALIASACSGAVLLAEAGLLDGVEATTHWAYCEALQRNYPEVRVRAERALVIAGEGDRLVMAGGGTSWLDLALYLVGRLVDLDTAVQLARINLIDWHAVGQQPFARLARTRQVDDAAIGKCQEWIARHYAATAPVASMVRISGLPERTFKRRFVAAIGMAPLEYVHAIRLEEAKRRLETTDAPIAEIALEVGYEDATFFSRLFRRRVRLTPASYRRRFGVVKRSLGMR
jgi:transcriptional regulator GlxA family with amidase domain